MRHMMKHFFLNFFLIFVLLSLLAIAFGGLGLPFEYFKYSNIKSESGHGEVLSFQPFPFLLDLGFAAICSLLTIGIQKFFTIERAKSGSDPTRLL